jgi:Opacity protein and related surface antigens
MKRLIVTLLAATGLSTAAFAADAPYNNSYNNNSYYNPAPVFTWAGFYAGLNAGYAWNGDDKSKIHDYYGPLGYGSSKKEDGFAGGLQVGYNFQSGSLIYGIEADINYSNMKRRDAGFGNYLSKAETYTVNSETSWFGTLRPRIGFAATDRLMVFATGGLAFGKVKTNGNYIQDSYLLAGDNDDVRYGWTLGAGAEYAITDNFTVKGEYAYIDLGEKTHSWMGRGYLNNLSVKDTTNFQLLRAGVNYKF